MPPRAKDFVRRPMLAISLIVLVALFARGVTIAELRRSPAFQTIKGDALAYDTWAQRIAGGEIIGREVFYQAPLYPYFLGTIYAVAGHHLLVVYVIQILLGAASCVLLWYATRVFFSSSTALAAGIMLAIYPPAVFFDLQLEKTVIDSFLLTALLAAMAWIQTRPRANRFLLAGAILGLLGLSRENALIFAPVLLWWAYKLTSFTGSGPGRYPAAVLIGLIISLAPVAIRNTIIGRELHMTTAQLGPNFYIGNNASADGVYRPLRPLRGDARFERLDATELAEQARGQKLSPKQVSRYWLGAALHDIVTHPIRWTGLSARKLWMVFNSAEIADTGDFDNAIAWSNYLQAVSIIFHFGVLLPLAAIGIALTWDRRTTLWPWHAMIVLFAISVAVFYLFARYRFPLVPMLMPFAAVTLVRIVSIAKDRKRRVRYAALAVIVAFAANTSLALPARIRGADYFNRGNAFQARGDIDSAVSAFKHALWINPKLVDPHVNLALILFNAGKIEESISHSRAALAIDPTNAEAHNNLAMAFAASDRPAEALMHFRAAVKSNPELHAARLNLAIALSQARSFDEAAEQLAELSKQRPDDLGVKIRLAQALASAGRRKESQEIFRQVLRDKPDWPPAQDALARLLATDPNSSFETASEAIALATAACRGANDTNPQMLDTLAAAYAQAGQFDAALETVRRARSLAIAASRGDLVRRLEQRVQLYQSRQPLREFTMQQQPATMRAPQHDRD